MDNPITRKKARRNIKKLTRQCQLVANSTNPAIKPEYKITKAAKTGDNVLGVFAGITMLKSYVSEWVS